MCQKKYFQPLILKQLPSWFLYLDYKNHKLLMKKEIFVFAVTLMMLSASSFAQTEGTSKFALQVSYGYGTSTVINGSVSSSLGSSFTEVLGLYRLNENWGLGTGVSLLGLNGNSFDENGNYNQTRGIFRVPVLLTSKQEITQKTHFIVHGGVFMSKIFEDYFDYLNNRVENEFNDWSLGVQTRMGISYDLSKFASVGFAYNLQYNFASFNENAKSLSSKMSSNIFDLSLTFKI
tara:strand:- start:33559 stop:34257 length:699 start_codon:yes stop_codon:yes gene_type:complete